MPSKNMIRKGKRRQTVKHEYRVHRDAVREAEAARLAALEEAGSPVHDETLETTAPVSAPLLPAIPVAPALTTENGSASFTAPAEAAGRRVDAYLAKALPETSRARVQWLIENGAIRVNGKVARASLKLEGGESIEVTGEPRPAPLHAEPESIPLTIVYEDADLAVIDKPAGMMVHAGAGSAEHNRGTMVNALLFHFQQDLSQGADPLRPGIVHRLDKETSGLLLVAKNDAAHRKLSEQFQSRAIRKVYLALVHGLVKADTGTIDLPIGRDPVRRTRMTTRRSLEDGARSAVTHWTVLQRSGTRESPGPRGPFSLLEVHIETGRTHQIRVHLASLGHPVAGDALYGAPAKLRRADDPAGKTPEPTLPRNFLHAARLELKHPRTGKALRFEAPLPEQLVAFARQAGVAMETAPPPGRKKAKVARLEAK